MIRAATSEDIEAIAALEAASFVHDAWNADQVRQEVAAADRHARVAAQPEEHVVGYAITVVRDDVADLYRIGVAPQHRRQGLARALLDDALAHARARRADRMLLEVGSSNAAAIGLYAAAGFTEIARRPRYYRDGSDAVVLRRSLGRGCGGG